MKKILLSLMVVLFVAVTAKSQTAAGNFYVGSAGHTLIKWSMAPFAPWASDSSVDGTFTGPFDVSDVDTLFFWVATSSNGASGKVNFNAALYLSPQGEKIPTNTASTAFLSQANSYDSTGVAIDTTSSKTKKLKYVKALPTNGAVTARLRFHPNISGDATLYNGTKSVVVIYVTGKKRFYGTPY